MNGREPPPRPDPRGLLSGISAYLLWGLAPIYFKAVAAVPAPEVLSHRIIWSVVMLAPVLASSNLRKEIKDCLGSRRTVLLLTLSSTLVAVNWLTAIYAVSTARVMQASLGYFLAPLASVALGVVVLGERLRPAKRAAVAIAAAGVLVPALLLSECPWIVLVLAVSFSFYGFLRKTMPAGPVAGTMVETWILSPVAVGYLALLGSASTARDPAVLGLLSLAGLVTSIPQLLFASAARRLPLAFLGLLQYLAPTVQLAVAVFLFGEPFSGVKALSFGCIWVALALFGFDAVREARSSPKG